MVDERIFIADFETSYINKEQLTLEQKKRERYADSIYIREVTKENGILFNNGKDTIKDFLDYITNLAKSNDTIKIGFHNLQYDWSYICYYLNSKGSTNKKKLNSYSYDEINDGQNMYASTLYFSYHNKGKNKKTGETIYKNYKVKFFDTYKIIPTSVEKMGKILSKTLNIDFRKGDFNYNKIRDYNYRLNEDEKAYIKRDVDIVTMFYNLLPNYMKEKLTLAGNAMLYYKNNSLPNNFINYDGKEEIIDEYKDKFNYLFPNKFYNNHSYIRQGVNYDGSFGRKLDKIDMESLNKNYVEYYFGGLTMVNPLYKGKLIINENYENKNNLVKYCLENNREYTVVRGKEIILDVNSLYPYIMYNSPLPYGTPIVVAYPTMGYIQKHHKNNFIFMKIVDVHGYLKENKLPFIPKNRKDKVGANTLYKDTLDGDTVCCNYDEWKLIKEHYEIESYVIEEISIFKCCKNVLFKKYIDEFIKMKIHYNEKLENGDINPNYNELMRQIAKLMLNTLYGKFGMKVDKDSILKFYDFENDKWSSLNKVERKRDYIYPILANAITSYARQYILSIIDSIDYDQFLYMDTDSIHMIENDKNNLESLTKLGIINSTELGKLDNENQTYCSIYLAPKKYAFINLKNNKLEIKCAGLPDDAKREIPTIENFYYGYETHTKNQKSYIRGGIDISPCKYRIIKPNDKAINNLNVCCV